MSRLINSNDDFIVLFQSSYKVCMSVTSVLLFFHFVVILLSSAQLKDACTHLSYNTMYYIMVCLNAGVFCNQTMRLVRGSICGRYYAKINRLIDEETGSLH